MFAYLKTLDNCLITKVFIYLTLPYSYNFPKKHKNPMKIGGLKGDPSPRISNNSSGPLTLF